MIEQVTLLNLGKAAQTVEQKTIDRLGRWAQGMGEGQVGYPRVPALGGTALAVEAGELQ